MNYVQVLCLYILYFLNDINIDRIDFVRYEFILIFHGMFWVSVLFIYLFILWFKVPVC